METKMNREVAEFNSSKKNKRYVSQMSGYAFVTCPDFSHQNGVYDFKMLRGGLPLHMTLSGNLLQNYDKPVKVFISDHEAFRSDVEEMLGLNRETMLSFIGQSLKVIKKDFPGACLLSEAYTYSIVEELKTVVPIDDHTERTLIQWSGQGFTRAILESRYREKYAQMYAFLAYCNQEKLCPVILYSKFNFNLLSVIRKRFEAMPAMFLSIIDPH